MSKPKLLEKIDNAGGVFIAIKGTTTYQEIKDAYDSGKSVVCYYDNAIFDLCTIPTGNNTLYFFDRYYTATSNNEAITNYAFLSMLPSGYWNPTVYHEEIDSTHTPIILNSSTPISSSEAYYRPIRLSTAEPTSSDGYVGDIWIQYEE